MKPKNLLILVTLFSLQISCMELVHVAKTNNQTCFEKLAQNNYNQMNADMEMLGWGKNASLGNILNARQGIQGPHPRSFNYSELNLESFKRIIHINPNTKDANGITPLYWACCTNNLETIQSLLRNTQTKPNTIINDRTVLHIACEWGKVEMVKLLLNNDKTDPNKKTSWGSTALDIARNKRRTEIIQLLLAHPNTQENNETPDSHSDLIDPNIKTTENNTTHDTTYNKGRTELVRLLLEISQNNPDIKTIWDNKDLEIARNKRLAKIKQLLEAQQNTENNNRDKIIEISSTDTDTTHVAPKKTQRNWLRKTITRNIKALCQTCYNPFIKTTQPSEEQYRYTNTAADNKRSKLLSMCILLFLVAPSLTQRYSHVFYYTRQAICITSLALILGYSLRAISHATAH